MNEKAHERVKAAAKAMQSQGGTMPEGTSKEPQVVEGIADGGTGHESAKSPGVGGKIFPGGGGSGGGSKKPAY